MTSQCARCGKASTLKCPVCVKHSLNCPSDFCSQECFKDSWSTHKYYHPGIYEPFPGFKFTGDLRPWPQGEDRKVPKGINRPDYADSGVPVSEFSVKNSSALNVPILNEEEKEKMRTVCRMAREVLDEASKHVKEGATGDEIDRIVHEACIKRGAYPSPFNYQGFPKSCCISVNEVICHGIPDQRPFLKGDIVNIDVTLFYDGFHGDLNETYIVGETDETSKKLIQCARDSLIKGIEHVKPGVPYKEIGGIVERHTKTFGFSVVKGFCGHGIGNLFHGPPSIPHYAKNRAVGIMKVGHCFTIEPMINVGHWQEVIWPDGWTAVTVDGKRSAQFEHTLLVTETGCEVLTASSNEKRFYNNIN